MKFLFLFFLIGATIKVVASTDTASVDTDIFVHELYQIENVDVPYLTASQSDVFNKNDIAGTDNFCIYSNTYTNEIYPQYQLAAVSDNAMQMAVPDVFISKNGGATIQYKVFYGIGPSASSFTELLSGASSENITMEMTPGSLCPGLGDNMTLKVVVSGADLVTAPAGIYSDTLIVDILPPLQ